MYGIEIELVKIGEKDYPDIAMALVENKEQYDIFKLTMNGCKKSLYLVPLVQVLDGISSVKSNYTIKDGKKYCSNCWREIEEGEEE